MTSRPAPGDVPLTTEEQRARGERRISETRAHVARCNAEVRAEISRLYDAERELTASVKGWRETAQRLTEENRALRSELARHERRADLGMRT